MEDKRQQAIDYITNMLRPLCVAPDDLTVDYTLDEKGVLLVVCPAKEDLGMIIGKGGETAQAIRSILRALGMRHDARYSLKVDDRAGYSSAQRN